MRSHFTKISIHIIAWVLLLMIPFLSTYQVVQSFVPDSEKFTLLPIIVLSLIMICVFYINYFLLIPKFLLKKKYLIYFISLFFCVSILVALSGVIFYIFEFNPDEVVTSNNVLSKISPIAKANAFLMFIISFIASISLVLNEKLKLTEKEKLSAELSSLKSQINPHFLFNTLNSIYGTAIENSPETADMVLKLSEMMRYTMSKTQNEFVAVTDELNYLRNYIELQKARLPSNIKINYSDNDNFIGLNIAPMLLITFIENAFKHGVNSEQNCFIDINISRKSNSIILKAFNNKIIQQNSIREQSGIGILNTKNRLELVYPNNHHLLISETEKSYVASLEINLA